MKIVGYCMFLINERREIIMQINLNFDFMDRANDIINKIGSSNFGRAIKDGILSTSNRIVEKLDNLGLGYKVLQMLEKIGIKIKSNREAQNQNAQPKEKGKFRKIMEKIVARTIMFLKYVAAILLVLFGIYIAVKMAGYLLSYVMVFVVANIMIAVIMKLFEDVLVDIFKSEPPAQTAEATA
jgi:hypothetical protein